MLCLSGNSNGCMGVKVKDKVEGGKKKKRKM